MACAGPQLSYVFGNPDEDHDDEALRGQWSAAEGAWAAVGPDHYLVHVAAHTPIVEKSEEDGTWQIDRRLAAHLLGRAVNAGGINQLSAHILLSDRLLTNILTKLATEGRMATAKVGKHYMIELITRVSSAVAQCGLYDAREDEVALSEGLNTGLWQDHIKVKDLQSADGSARALVQFRAMCGTSIFVIFH